MPGSPLTTPQATSGGQRIMHKPLFVRTNLDNLSHHFKTGTTNENKKGVPALAAIDRVHTSCASALHFRKFSKLSTTDTKGRSL